MLADERNRLMLMRPGGGKSLPGGWKLSLFAYGGPVEGLTLEQVQYPLTQATLTTDNPVGVSNEFGNKPAKIGFIRYAYGFFIKRLTPPIPYRHMLY